MMLIHDVTAGRIREALDYDPLTGGFIWRVSSRGHRAGSIAGAAHNGGYRRVMVDRRSYLAHRLAWFYVHGEWPPAEIDHINGDRSDNRIANLRLATRSQNAANICMRSDNTSGFKGVSWFRQTRKWSAQIGVGGKMRHLGYFNTAREAHAAYIAATHEHFGEFVRTA